MGRGEVLFKQFLQSQFFDDAPVSIGAAFAALNDEEDRPPLQNFLSGLLPGPPLSSTTQRNDSCNGKVLQSLTVAESFRIVAASALYRIKTGCEKNEHHSEDDDDDEGFVDEPPFAFKVAAATMREATVEEHKTALLIGFSLTSLSPYLVLNPEDWGQYVCLHDDNNNGVPAEDNNASPIRRALDDELQAIEFHKELMTGALLDTPLMSRLFLWRERDDYILTILYTALLFLIAPNIPQLPARSSVSVSSLLPKLVTLVASIIGDLGEDPKVVVAAARKRVTDNLLASFMATSIARAIPTALDMTFEECQRCGYYWPEDAFLRFGDSDHKCKMCFEGEVKAFLEAETKTAEYCLKFEKAVNTHRAIIHETVVADLRTTLQLDEDDKGYTAMFKCPFNDRGHQKPFLVPMPAKGAPVEVQCTQCKVVWCAHCSYAHHPNAGSCEKFLEVKTQWYPYREMFKDDAQTNLDDFEKEKKAAALFNTDRVSFVTETRRVLREKILRSETLIDDISARIEQTHKTNTFEMEWDKDGGYPKVKGSRRCPHCGRQPIRRVSKCRHMICGRNTEGAVINDQAGCGGKFSYIDDGNKYQPFSTADDEAERSGEEAKLQQLRLTLGSLETLTKCPIPTLPNHWPELACSHCHQQLLGDFHLECFHCTSPKYLLCVRCTSKDAHLNAHHIRGDVDRNVNLALAEARSGHVFAKRKPSVSK